MRSAVDGAGFSDKLLGGCILATGTGTTVGLRYYRQRVQSRPEIIKVQGGQAIPLQRSQPITIGGERCSLVVPGVPTGTVLAHAEWTDARGELTLRPGAGMRLQVGGVDVPDHATYRLGQTFHCIDAHGQSYTVTLCPGTDKELGFGPVPSSQASGWSAEAGFPSFGDAAWLHAGHSSPVLHGDAARNGTGTQADTYI